MSQSAVYFSKMHVHKEIIIKKMIDVARAKMTEIIINEIAIH